MNWAEKFFTEGYLDIFQALGKFDHTQDEAIAITQLLRLPEGSHLLDIPCGFGRFSRALFNAKFKVTAVDSSDYLLSIARSENPGPLYLRGDMRDPPPGPYDAILNLWTSFGYFETPAEDHRSLAAWFSELKPGGVFIMEISDRERALSENPSLNSTTYKTRTIAGVTEDAWIDWDASEAVIRYSFLDKILVGKTRIYSRQQLISMIQEVGFSSYECFGGFDKRDKRPCDRLVIRAQK